MYIHKILTRKTDFNFFSENQIKNYNVATSFRERSIRTDLIFKLFIAGASCSKAD